METTSRKRPGRPRSTEKRVVTTITMDIDTLDKLHEYSDLQGIPVSILINEEMKKFLENNTTK